MLFLCSSVFLLRVPSECLPVVHGGIGVDHSLAHSVVMVSEDAVILRLLRRKNKLAGSRLTRCCWCPQCKQTCPVIVLGTYFAGLSDGVAPFAASSSCEANVLLRRCLELEGVASARS